jgi:SpoVK/Ycf46/Vps4 family AAA+-type ATPase
MQKPLYNMSAAELGDVAQEVEQKLDCALELSTRWGAVLLLDECDVFLERRTTSDIKRNKLVSIFLRLLEYFEGVMFLTTNRVSAFDPAFESRIHLTIHYPNLDYTSRLHIWKTFVNTGTDGNSLSEDDLNELASVELNGRQIKNVAKTARLLATHERTKLAMGHISTVLRIKKGLAGGL